MTVSVCVTVCVCMMVVCDCMCVFVCDSVCVCVCVCAHGPKHSMFDPSVIQILAGSCVQCAAQANY